MADGNPASQVPLPTDEKVDFDFFGPPTSPPGIGSSGGNGPAVSAQAAGSTAGSPQQPLFSPQHMPNVPFCATYYVTNVCSRSCRADYESEFSDCYVGTDALITACNGRPCPG